MLVLLAATSRGSEALVNQWGPFKGQVVDAETAKPIPGAIFFAIWMRIIPTPIHAGEKFNDARFAVADSDGRFEIPRRTPPMFPSLVETVYLACVAPGYKPLDGTGVVPPPLILRLTRFQTTEKERHLGGNGYSANIGLIPHDRRAEFERAINEKRHEVNLPPISLRGAL